MTASKRGLGYGDLAQIMQADLKKIGVNAKIVDLDVAQYEARSQKGDIVIMIHSYGRANRDPGTLLTAAKAWQNEKEGNWTHWNSRSGTPCARSSTPPSTRRSARRPPASSRRWRWTNASRSSSRLSSARGPMPPTSRGSPTIWRTR